MPVTTSEPAAGGHVAHLSRDDGDVISDVARRLQPSLLDGGGVVFAATPAHQAAVCEQLTGAGVDVDARRGGGRLTFLDAEALADEFTGADVDESTFERTVGTTMRAAASRSRGRRLDAYGEIVGILWEAGATSAAVELERYWHRLQAELGFSLACAYPSYAGADAETGEAFAQVCHLHTGIAGGAPLPATAEATCLLDPAPVAPRTARRWVTETLERWDRGDLVDDAALVVTELATNAVVHAASVFTVSLARVDDAVQMAVGDTSALPPAPRHAHATAPDGRGLALVGAVSVGWRHTSVDGGKIVSVELSGVPS